MSAVGSYFVLSDGKSLPERSELLENTPLLLGIAS
jgi:hypothetical protein